MWQWGLMPGACHGVIRPELNYKTADKIHCHLLATRFEGVKVTLTMCRTDKEKHRLAIKYKRSHEQGTHFPK